MHCKDSRYKMEFPVKKMYRIDAEGGIGYPIYFGIHFANDMGLEGRNIIVNPQLRVFALRDIKRHEELFNWYGDNVLQNKNFTA